MAHIDVVKKKANPWPWILLLVVALAIAGYFIWRNSENAGENPVGTTDSTNTTTAPDTTRQ